MEFNSTLGWQNWSNKVGMEFDLQEGPVQIKIEVVAANFNLNYLDFKLINVPAESGMNFIKGYTNDIGDKLILDFNKPVDQEAISADGFVLVVNGEEVQFNTTALENTKSIGITPAKTFEEGDIIKVGYESGGTIVSDAQEALVLFGLELIKNNVIELNLLAIPGKIEVEDFVTNKGFEFETCTDTGGGQNAGYTDNGDYLDFDVNVAEDGSYDIFYRVASESAGGSMSLQKIVNGSASTLSTVSFSATGGWQNWTTVEDQVTLEKGELKFRLLSKGSLFNINWFEFKKASGQVLGLLDEGQEFKIYPNPGSNYFYVKFEQSEIESNQIHIFDVSGHPVDFEISDDFNNQLLINHNLYPGFYLMSINGLNGRITKKIIIE